MSRTLIFWVLMLLWCVSGLFGYFGPPAYARWGLVSNDLLAFILFGLLGWETYGPAVQGK